MLEQLKDIYGRYNARGFRNTSIYGDLEFEIVRSSILPTRTHTCVTDEHILIEHSVQTQKNENRHVHYTMPHRWFPRLMVRDIITQGNAFLNAFADSLSPRNMIENVLCIYYNDLKHEFGQCV